MSSHSEGGDDICAENPPHCDVKQRSVNGTSGTFSTPFHTGIDIIVIQMNITSTSPTVCAIDPLVLAAQVLDYEVTDVTQLTLLINCARSDTRIVIRPVNNLTFPLILGFVHISNCVLYWKDLSKLGNFLSIQMLLLVGWQDEFGSNSSGIFFHKCVKFSTSKSDSADHALVSYDEKFPISGLDKIWTLWVSSHVTRSVSPVFTDYLWPAMAEISFNG